MRVHRIRPSRPVLCAGTVMLFAASISLWATGCGQIPGGTERGAPKAVQVRFDTFDIGSDDCEDTFSFGDFSVRMTVTVQPRNERVFRATRSFELGSAAFQAPLNRPL